MKSLIIALIATTFCLLVMSCEEKPKVNEEFVVEINDKGVVNVVVSTLPTGNSYCCTWENGVKCYSSDCSACGCME